MFIEKINMKNKILFLLFSFTGLLSFGQSPKYDDLKILFADAQYEKLVKDAEKYVNKPDLAEDPIPNVYLSMGLYKISFTSVVEEDPAFSDAREAAFEALGVAMELDKNGSKLDDYAAYINEVQEFIYGVISNEIEIESYTKASTYIKTYAKVTKNAKAAAKLFEGYTKYLKDPDDAGSAESAWEKAIKMLMKDSLNDPAVWTKNDLLIAKNGLIGTIKSMIAIENIDNIDLLLEYFKPVFREDEAFLDELEKIYR
jgi:hypothetical protein